MNGDAFFGLPPVVRFWRYRSCAGNRRGNSFAHASAYARSSMLAPASTVIGGRVIRRWLRIAGQYRFQGE